MNLEFLDEESDIAFTEALFDFEVVRQWLLNRLTSYSSQDQVKRLEIGIDTFTKGDKPSFDWRISSGSAVIINGGLIYHSDGRYSSHT